jgi:hypothetical protein
MSPKEIPLEYRSIIDWVSDGSSVLDLGCGDGELLSLLTRAKHVRAQGIEIDEKAIYQCVGRGISVFHEDIDNGLPEYSPPSCKPAMGKPPSKASNGGQIDIFKGMGGSHLR